MAHPEDIGINSFADIFTVCAPSPSSEWRSHYGSLVERVAHARITEELPDDLLEDLWLTRKNGVSSLSLGILSGAQFLDVKEELRPLTISIIRSNSENVYQEARQLFKRLAQENRVRGVLTASINRVFAAAHPSHITSTIAPERFRQLSHDLTRLDINIKEATNWLEANKQLWEHIRSAVPQGLQAVDANIAIWNFYEQLRSVEKEQAASAKASALVSDERVSPSLPLNQVFYGPPGTGKTHKAVDEAVRIADPTFYRQAQGEFDDVVEFRSRLKRRFDELVAEQRIGFTTFHQSLSYEDFVEGIKAETVSGEVTYSLEDGIFKRICEHAISGSAGDKADAALQNFKERAAEGPVELKTATGKPFNVRYSGGKTFLCNPHSSPEPMGLSANIEHVRSWMLGRTPEKAYQPSYGKAIAAHLQKEANIPTDPDGNEGGGLPHVLIIDEINRGNISKILGELITLLEPNKRAGAEESLSVILPYSKESFSVPTNLYVIGTMNTADTSLARLDIALRRRFEFSEVMPDASLLEGTVVEGVDVFKVLSSINERIELLYDRDHAIGHSYFMDLDSTSRIRDLRRVFANHVIPLLEEYFFEDWELIHQVLGDHLKADNQHKFIVPKYSENDIVKLMGPEWVKHSTAQRWRVNESALLQPDAYKGVYTGEVL